MNALSNEAASSHLHIWTVYDHPIDMPEWFVARQQVIGLQWPEASYRLIFHRDLHALRRAFARAGLYRLPRDCRDDAAIVEVWL